LTIDGWSLAHGQLIDAVSLKAGRATIESTQLLTPVSSSHARVVRDRELLAEPAPVCELTAAVKRVGA
jgi:hypothetical protein